MKKLENTIKSLVDDSKWKGGWYQDITFPTGERTVSTTVDFDKAESRGSEKWEIIKPYIHGHSLLDIGCNAGLYLVLAAINKNIDVLYGLDISPHFLKQAKLVLKEFNLNAELFCEDATKFNFEQTPVDTTIMVNALYWIVYSDESGFIQDSDKEMDSFLERLQTHYLITVGAEHVNRVGGNLTKTIPVIDKFYSIKEAKTVPLKDRTLNVIYARKRDT